MYNARQLNNTNGLVLSGKKKKKEVARVSLLNQTPTFKLYTEIYFLPPATDYMAEFKFGYCIT